MSVYYEAIDLKFEDVKRDIEAGKIKGIKIVSVEGDCGFESADHLCISAEGQCVWLRPGDFQGGLGLKRWGQNDESKPIALLEKHYRVNFYSEYDFEDEDGVGVLHVG